MLKFCPLFAPFTQSKNIKEHCFEEVLVMYKDNQRDDQRGNHFGKWCGATKRGRMERNDNKNLIRGVIACINIQHAIGQRYV